MITPATLQFHVYEGRLSIWCDVDSHDWLADRSEEDSDLASLFDRFVDAWDHRLGVSDGWQPYGRAWQPVIDAWFAWRDRLGANPSGIYGEGEPCPVHANEDSVLGNDIHGYYVSEGPTRDSVACTYGCEYLIVTGREYSTCRPYLVESNGQSELGIIDWSKESLAVVCPGCHYHDKERNGYRSDLEEARPVEVNDVAVLTTRAPVKAGIVYHDGCDILCPQCGAHKLEAYA